MNTALVTTGLVPLTVGSVETFQPSAYLDGLPWDLAGATVTLALKGPGGVTVAIAATVAGGVATASWEVTGPAGDWTRAWTITDAQGRRQVSRPIAFSVVVSP